MLISPELAVDASTLFAAITAGDALAGACVIGLSLPQPAAANSAIIAHQTAHVGNTRRVESQEIKPEIQSPFGNGPSVSRYLLGLAIKLGLELPILGMQVCRFSPLLELQSSVSYLYRAYAEMARM
jgi:hypothetical protein